MEKVLVSLCFFQNSKKAHDPSISIWICNDSTGVVDVIKLLKLLRSEVDKASPLLLQSFDLSTLYTKIRPNGSKSLYWKLWLVKCLIRCWNFIVLSFCWFEENLWTSCFCGWRIKKRNSLEYLHSFKVVEASDVISWSDFLLDNLFLCFGHCASR
jgi:hypothetical protein